MAVMMVMFAMFVVFMLMFAVFVVLMLFAVVLGVGETGLACLSRLPPDGDGAQHHHQDEDDAAGEHRYVKTIDQQEF